jgi:hypothetical protein
LKSEKSPVILGDINRRSQAMALPVKKLNRASFIGIALLALASCRSGVDPEPETKDVTNPPSAYTVRLIQSGEAEESTKSTITREETPIPFTNGVQIAAAAGGEVALGNAKIRIPAGALEEDTEIRITRLWRVEDTIGVNLMKKIC